MLGQRHLPRTLTASIARGRGTRLPTGWTSGWPATTPSARADRLRARAAPTTAVVGRYVRSEELARIEAALFVAREPLSLRRLAKLARLADGSRARVLVKELRRLQDEAGSAFRVESIAGGVQLLTRAPFGPWVRRLIDSPPSHRLSTAGLETLAIVAYRQPVTRAEIEAIRGVGSEEMLRQLLERDYVAVGGRAEELGRPHVYGTTRRFLAAFGLARLEDLPPLESLPGFPGPADGPGEEPPPGADAG